MRAYALLRAPDGSHHELVHGDIVGRLRTAAMHLDDGRVSEAHAMVSLREGELRLIALRGAFAVGGRPLAEVTLASGMRVQLARGLEVEVVEVRVPEAILGLEGEGLPRQALPGVCSVLEGDRPRVVHGWQEGAAAWIWSTGEGWRLRQGRQPARDVRPGDVVEPSGLRFVAIPLAAAGQEPTRQGGGIDAPLRLVAHYDTVHLHRDGDVVASLSGVLARLVSELVAMNGPVSWQVLAEELWPGGEDPAVLRQRLDANLSRIRRKLREARVRTDLVRTDGAGSVELLLYPHDQVEDRT